MKQDQPGVRTASCLCGELTATVNSEPSDVYICSCLDCQKLSGSSFTYCAIYAEENVATTGAKTWRYRGDSGRWIETLSCPTCSGLVCYRLEAYPGSVLISVGCFADPDFPKPDTLYYAPRRHRWLAVPDNVEALDEQGDDWGAGNV